MNRGAGRKAHQPTELTSFGVTPCFKSGDGSINAIIQELTLEEVILHVLNRGHSSVVQQKRLDVSPVQGRKRWRGRRTGSGASGPPALGACRTGGSGGALWLNVSGTVM